MTDPIADMLTRIRNAKGETAKFQALLLEYNQAKEITKKRMYLEAMEGILSQPGIEKIILDNKVAGKALPLLPLSQKGLSEYSVPKDKIKENK